ncbi:transforming growth factor-beta receptor-associated protein 1 [Clonorchis sinensis]|uniref:Transforming growth factor-beta receptor-associated protein 1 n=1 Tax=Clonorchis sinensis TaxID=79923 RepID=G7Y2V2_CLOSI|nr:transforming growth factor-beta receptor-associated protein 1 [Clonorchis sinensis]
MNADVKYTAKNCVKCAHEIHDKSSQWYPWRVTCEIFRRVHADYCGPFRGKYYALIVIDPIHVGLMFFYLCLCAEFTQQALRKVFSHEVVPTALVTDNDKHFTARSLRNGTRNLQTDDLATERLADPNSPNAPSRDIHSHCSLKRHRASGPDDPSPALFKHGGRCLLGSTGLVGSKSILTVLNSASAVTEETLEVVERFAYLGSCVSSDNRVMDEVNGRICKARVAFASLRPMASKRFILGSQGTCVSGYSTGCFFYGCETCPVRAAQLRLLKVLSNRCPLTIVRVDWCRPFRNEAIRNTVTQYILEECEMNETTFSYVELLARTISDSDVVRMDACTELRLLTLLSSNILFVCDAEQLELQPDGAQSAKVIVDCSVTLLVQLCLAFLTRFIQIYRITPTNASLIFEHKLTVLPSSLDEFLISGPGSLGVIVDANGTSHRPPLQLSPNVLSVFIWKEYVFSLTDEFFTIHSIFNQKQLQTVLLPNAVAGCFSSRNPHLVFVAYVSKTSGLVDILSIGPERWDRFARKLILAGCLQQAKQLLQREQQRVEDIFQAQPASSKNEQNVFATMLLFDKINPTVPPLTCDKRNSTYWLSIRWLIICFPSLAIDLQTFHHHHHCTLMVTKRLQVNCQTRQTDQQPPDQQPINSLELPIFRHITRHTTRPLYCMQSMCAIEETCMRDDASKGKVVPRTEKTGETDLALEFLVCPPSKLADFQEKWTFLRYPNRSSLRTGLPTKLFAHLIVSSQKHSLRFVLTSTSTWFTQVSSVIKG